MVGWQAPPGRRVLVRYDQSDGDEPQYAWVTRDMSGDEEPAEGSSVVHLDMISTSQASSILGVTETDVHRHVVASRLRRHGRPEADALSRSAVERLAARVYPWRRFVGDPSSYWVTGGAAAAILGISRVRLGQLSAERRLPFVSHTDGTRLYRRYQLEELASARLDQPATGARAWNSQGPRL